MKLLRSVILGRTSMYNILEMRNTSDEDMYVSLIECDGGITGEFDGWSRLGKSGVKTIYKTIPEDDADEEDECEKGGCYVGRIPLPSGSEIEKGATESHIIPLLKKDGRPPMRLVAHIAPHDFVSIWTDQREVYKLIDDSNNEIPLESLLRSKQSP